MKVKAASVGPMQSPARLSVDPEAFLDRRRREAVELLFHWRHRIGLAVIIR